MDQFTPESRRFDVHLFPVVQLTIRGLAADSPKEAVERANEQVGPTLPTRLGRSEAEYVEEISH